jgi:hypothetical protein
MLATPTDGQTPSKRIGQGCTLPETKGDFAPVDTGKTPEWQNLTRFGRKRPGIFTITKPCDAQGEKRQTTMKSGKNSKTGRPTFCLYPLQTLGIYRTKKLTFGTSQGVRRSIQDLQLKRHKNVTRRPPNCDGGIYNAVKTGKTASQGVSWTRCGDDQCQCRTGSACPKEDQN